MLLNIVGLSSIYGLLKVFANSGILYIYENTDLDPNHLDRFEGIFSLSPIKINVTTSFQD